MKSFVSIVVLLVASSNLMAQPEIYFSFTDFGDGGAIDNTTGKFSVGESGSAFIWVDDDVLADGLIGTNVGSSFNDLLFTSVEVFNPELLITVGGDEIPAGPRWQNIVENLPNANLIGFGGLGIQPIFDGSGAIVDPLYDPLSEAFLFGRVDFVVLDEGPIELFLFDTNFINTNGEEFPKTGSVIISTIPEPSAATLAITFLATVVLRRKTRS